MEPTNIRTVSASGGVKSYLIAYNAVQTIGWTILFLKFCNYHISSDQGNKSLYENIEWPLLIFQSAAVLEIVHAITGIVPADLSSTAIQVLLRLGLTCIVLPNVEASHNCLGLSFTILAWSVTEIIRYGYFTLNLVKMAPYFLKWLRYSTFFVLVPVGSLGEILCFEGVHEMAAEKGIWEHKPSNSVLGVLLFAPFIIRQYNHLLAQRRKVFGDAEGVPVANKNK